MLFLPENPSHARVLAKRVERGALRRIARGIYSDDFDRSAEEQVATGVMAIVGRLLPQAYVSHSSAALRAPINGLLFVSGPAGKRNAVLLPGVRVVRLPALPHPEIERVDAPTLVVRTRNDEPGPVMVGLSSALQTVFECLMPARHYPERRLPDAALLDLIEQLSARDRQRAAAFAERNGLRREHERFRELTAGRETRAAVHAPGLRRFDLYFYNWHVGSLTALGNAEFRYEYAPAWGIELSRELPVHGQGGMSYEGPRMPAFFENFLPEGWAENRILRTHHLDRNDRVGLLASTRKYLSNLTLRPLDIPESELRLDTHSVRLADIAPDAATVVQAREQIEHHPETAKFWRELRARGAVGLSGIQPKLPVSLALESGEPSVHIGDLRNPCTHILKLQSPHYELLVENEWATMELSRRAGLATAPVRLVDFGEGSPFRGKSLLVERFDIPDRTELEHGNAGLELALQEDTCSLLLLARTEKYRTSLERVALALRYLGLSADPDAPGLWALVRHVAFSWLVANGDLHAKNVSALRVIRPGTLGAPPTLRRVEYSPLYDLLNTRLAIPDDDFALPVNGRKSNVRVRDIAELASRWKGGRSDAEDQIMAVAVAVRLHLDDVLGCMHLPAAMAERYRQIVDGRLRTFGV